MGDFRVGGESIFVTHNVVLLAALVREFTASTPVFDPAFVNRKTPRLIYASGLPVQVMS